jgi:hypothetical protein
MHLRPFIAIGATTALLASGCGSGSASQKTVDVHTWHDSVCTAVDHFAHDAKHPYYELQGLSLQFTYGLPKQSETRTKELAATEALANAGASFRSSVEAAGVPRVNGGLEYDRAVIAALRQFEADMRGLHDRAGKLPQGDGPASKDALLTPAFESSLKRLGAAMTKARSHFPVHLEACSANTSKGT